MLGYSLENPDLSIELWKDLSLGLIVKGVSKVVLYSVPLMLTLAKGIYILFEKFAPEII